MKDSELQEIKKRAARADQCQTAINNLNRAVQTVENTELRELICNVSPGDDGLYARLAGTNLADRNNAIARENNVPGIAKELRQAILNVLKSRIEKERKIYDEL